MEFNKKMGRPTDNPLTHDIKVRVDNETLLFLNEYCLKNNVKRAEAIREGINLLRQNKTLQTLTGK